MKKICALFLFLCALVICPLALADQNGSCGADGDNLSWLLTDDGNLTISGNGAMADYLNYGDNIAPWGSDVKHVIIGNGVTSIGKYAFYNCASMQSVEFPETVKCLGENAFGYNYGTLKAIDLPDGLERIEKSALWGLISIGTISIPRNVRYIEDTGLPSNIRTIEVSEQNQWFSIRDGILYNKDYTTLVRCPTSLSGTLSVPDGTLTIRSYAISGCQNLTSIFVPDSVKTIEANAFSSCSGLTEVRMPAALESFELYFTFSSDYNLASFIVPEGTTDIRYGAFSYCKKLKSVTIPSSVKTIDPQAFNQCPNDMVLHVTAGSYAEQFAIDNGYGYETSNPFEYRITGDQITITGYTGSGTAISIPEAIGGITVTEIGENTFPNNGQIRVIYLPASITSIEGNPFLNCGQNLKLMVSYQSYAMQYAMSHGINYDIRWDEIYEKQLQGDNTILLKKYKGSAENAVIPERMNGYPVTGIDFWTFRLNSSLKSVTVPDGVNNIGNNAFENNVIVYARSGSEAAKAISKSGHSFRETNKNYSARYLYSGETVIGLEIDQVDQDVESFDFPEGTTRIGADAFKNCKQLKTLCIPDSVTIIGNSAFYNCPGLTSINLPEGIKVIGNYAFSGCYGLKIHLVIPEGITEIGSNAFASCGLSSITIPDEFENIGTNAFYGNSYPVYVSPGSPAEKAISKSGDSFRNPGKPYDLKYLYTGDDITGLEISRADKDITFIEFPENVTEIGNAAFQSCRKLSEVRIPDGVVRIGVNAFQGSTISKVSIPDTVTQIDYGAFTGCDNLTEVSIPPHASVGKCAFYWDQGIEKVYIPQTVTQFGEDVFVDEGFGEYANSPTIYCYKDSAADKKFNAPKYYLDRVNAAEYRTITTDEAFILPIGDSHTISAYVFPDMQEQITWTSSNPQAATVDEGGNVTATGKGTATITATIGTTTGTTEVRAYQAAESFELMPAEMWITYKEEIQPAVTSILPEGAEVHPTWTCSGTKKATIDGEGRVTTYYKVNDITVTATSEHLVQRQCLIHVCPEVTEIQFENAREVLVAGDSIQLNALVKTELGNSYTNKLIRFSSSDEDILTVDENGYVQSYQIGRVTITAAAADGVTAELPVHVICREHGTEETDPAVAPTCMETGLTEGTHCTDCGYILTAQLVIPALGHDWEEPSYTWAADYQHVTAERVCRRDSSHRESETTGAEITVVAEPTCIGNGTADCVSHAFENPAFQEQEIKNAALMPEPENHQPTEEFPATKPGCTTAGRTEKIICEHCRKVLQESEEIPATGHVPVTISGVPATTSGTGLTGFTYCSTCGIILENEYIIPPTKKNNEGFYFEDGSGFIYEQYYTINERNTIAYVDYVGRKSSRLDFTLIAIYDDGTSDVYLIEKPSGQERYSASIYTFIKKGNLKIYQANINSDANTTDAVLQYELTKPGTVYATLTGDGLSKRSQDLHFSYYYTPKEGIWKIDFATNGSTTYDMSSENIIMYLEEDGKCLTQTDGGISEDTWSVVKGQLLIGDDLFTAYDENRIAVPLSNGAYAVYKRVAGNNALPYLGTWKAYTVAFDEEGLTFPLSQFNASIYKTVYINANNTTIIPVDETEVYGTTTIKNGKLYINGQDYGFSFNQYGQLTRKLKDKATVMYMRIGGSSFPDTTPFMGPWYGNRIVRKVNDTNESVNIDVDTSMISFEAKLLLDGSIEVNYCGHKEQGTWSIQDNQFTTDGISGKLSCSMSGELQYALGQDYYLCCTRTKPGSAGQATTLPASLTNIEEEAFCGLPVKSVILPNRCRTIGRRAFANCAALTYVYVPDSVKSIDPSAFTGSRNVFLICQSDNAGAAFARRNGIGYAVR